MAALAMCVTAGVMLMAWVWGSEWLRAPVKTGEML